MRLTISVGLILLSPGVSLGEPLPLTARIDELLGAAWRAEKITPAVHSDDAVFARRVYLDLVGRVPTIPEIRSFLDDQSKNKRANLVKSLLASPGHARHWATFWRREWIPQADQPRSPLPDEFEPWLAQRIRNGDRYDRIVRDVLAAGTGSDAPRTFLAASTFKPENLAANTTRAFLGINLDCAQCHDHPFAVWTRDQFWQTAAFFVPPNDAKFELAIPETNKIVEARLLSGRQPEWPVAPSKDTGRTILAAWITSQDNPYFARNAVNRVWAKLFGAGLVEPLDDLSNQNPGRHPRLLDELARGFSDGGFDVKELTTAIVLSRAYQQSSQGRSGEAQLFARAAVRGLSGEQLYDSLRVAAGLPVERDDLEPRQAHSDRRRFVEKFHVERPGAAQRSILQALSLMNGKQTAEWTDVRRAPTLRAVAELPFLDTEGQVEALFLAALARKPTTEEVAVLVPYVNKGGADRLGPKHALADIFWALLNSSEFNTNH
ncbi:MAG: DUF1553 domain-containing protein [Gemmataceae bacterium]